MMPVSGKWLGNNMGIMLVSNGLVVLSSAGQLVVDIHALWIMNRSVNGLVTD